MSMKALLYVCVKYGVVNASYLVTEQSFTCLVFQVLE